MRTSRWGAAVAVAVLFAPGMVAQESKLKYPETKKVDHVDTYHGTKVADPYRWLEDDVRVSKDVAAWVEEQNKVTQAFLATIPEREAIKARMTELWNYEKFTAPFKAGGKYFFFKNNGLQNQNVLFVQDALDAEPRLLMDPNTWTKDGTIALAGLAPSDDGKFLAFGKAAAGSDWTTWHVLDVASGKELSDDLRWVKFSGASWTNDGKGFYYSRFPEPAKDAKFQGLNVDMKLYYHRVGTAQSEDALVYERPDQPKWMMSGTVTDDGKYLVVSLSDGTTSRKSRIYVKDLSDASAKVTPLIDNHENKYFLVGNEGATLFFRTECDAPKGRVIAIDLAKPEKANWKTLVPEAKETLEGVSTVGGQFVCSYLQDAKTQVKVFDLKGTLVREVKLPGIGTAAGFGGKITDAETFYVRTECDAPKGRVIGIGTKSPEK